MRCPQSVTGPAPQHNHGALAVIFEPATPDQTASGVPRWFRPDRAFWANSA
jgi:hypothetical protein